MSNLFTNNNEQNNVIFSTTIPTISSIIIASLGLIFNIILLIPSILSTKSQIHPKLLSIQFIIGSIFCNIFNIIFNLDIYIQIHCLIIEILRIYCLFPVLSSSLCITLNSFFILTGNVMYQKRQTLILLLFAFVTWIPTSLPLIIIIIDFNKLEFSDTCIPEKPEYLHSMVGVITFIYLIPTVIICLIIIINICMLQVKHYQQRKKTKKKVIKLIILYIIGAIIFICLNMFSFGSPLIQGTARNYLVLILNLFIPFMTYTYVWNPSLKVSFMKIYCCKDDNNNLLNNKDDEKQQGEDDINELGLSELSYREEEDLEKN